MQGINPFIQITQWVRSKTLQTFVKNFDAPRSVIVFINGIAINRKRRLAEHARIVHKYSSNCGFQDKQHTLAEFGADHTNRVSVVDVFQAKKNSNTYRC